MSAARSKRRLAVGLAVLLAAALAAALALRFAPARRVDEQLNPVALIERNRLFMRVARQVLDIEPIGRDDECAGADCMTVRLDPGRKWKCGQTRDEYEACINDYLAFAFKARPHARPISERELQRQLELILAPGAAVEERSLSEQELRRTLIDRLNVGFLLQGIGRRQLDVSIVSETKGNDYTTRELLLSDPYVGEFKGVLLLPNRPPPFPAVLAVPGHGCTADDFRREHLGHEFPKRGLAILVLEQRGMDTGPYENLLTRVMLLNGFSVLDLRCYETLLTLQYLRSLPELQGQRIGLIGYSEGSLIANLIVRIDPGFAALVSDLQSNYVNILPGSDVLLLEETTPLLYPYHTHINDFQTSSTPVLAVPHGLGKKREEIFDFFASHLQPTEQPAHLAGDLED